MRYGYARVRKHQENLATQEGDLCRAGCGHVFHDIATGGECERPGLIQALGVLRPGDILVVRRLDRLGRGMDQLMQVARELERRQAGLIALREGIDTTAAGGPLFTRLLAALADFERRAAWRP